MFQSDFVITTYVHIYAMWGFVSLYRTPGIWAGKSRKFSRLGTWSLPPVICLIRQGSVPRQLPIPLVNFFAYIIVSFWTVHLSSFSGLKFLSSLFELNYSFGAVHPWSNSFLFFFTKISIVETIPWRQKRSLTLRKIRGWEKLRSQF